MLGLGTLVSQVGGQLAQNVDINQLTSGQILSVFLIVGALILLSIWINMWIWNNVLVRYVSFIRPVESIWHFFLITFLIKALFTTECWK